ncbi:MAG: dihydroneopterin aldolase [Pseudomonadota bacterium]
MNDASGHDGFSSSAFDAAMATRDRIFLSNHVREVEIGAYREEFGVTQRLRFNVALDVRRFEISYDDEVESIVSYDTIVDAIEALIAGERLKLLETFAERLAVELLADKRVIAAHIRIEKLDRVIGSLGVEITRTQAVAL